uniref:Uncharacterized protein n=1 Tax=Arundo donax TaxID=35708 RepID=A0A0A9BZ49_ARUDO
MDTKPIQRESILKCGTSCIICIH